MENHIIRKEDGTIIKWNKSNNNYFCLLYNDNSQKYYFTPAQDLNCSVFMIGGGGAGGYFFGGGGGAGAAYMNDNFIFKKNTSYSFEIGTGGRCDIDNINNLFQKGFNLTVYNNTTPKLDNVKFSGNDYSSLGLASSSIVQSYIINNVNIPATIFNNNTTYIWDGYIKPNKNFVRITINSKIKVMIWVDKKVYDNASTIVDGIIVNDVKVIELDTNKYVNVKIIAYNFDTAKSDFNVNFEDCELFNFNKKGEVYNYTEATDTNIIYRTEENKSYIIKCKGGGNGGCGLYNQNEKLDGGCGGGSGINKKNGKAIIDPSFNGNDGAIGTYCGGGGGIISAGNDSKGGKGKIIEWFNKNAIFGAGGNGASLKEERNLGYGCGGDGADCCQFSKLDINNNGNNGCVLIYLKNLTEKSEDKTIEGFANNDKDNTYYNEHSIITKLISESFSVFNNSDPNIITSNLNRKTYFENIGQTFAKLCFDDDSQEDIVQPSAPASGASPGASDYKYNAALKDGHNDMNNFIYDMLVASKLFGVIYRLYYNEFKNTHQSNIVNFKKFAENVKIKFTKEAGAETKIVKVNPNDKLSYEYLISINSLFDITNLKLYNNNQTENSNYKTVIYGGSNIYSLNMSSECFEASIEDIGIIEVPYYHTISDRTYIRGFEDWYLNNYANKKFVNNIDPILIEATDKFTTTNEDYNTCDDSRTGFDAINTSTMNTCGSSSNVVIPLNHKNSNSHIYLDKDRLNNIYEANKAKLNTDLNIYKHQRILFHLENFNIILNTNPDILLNTLKYYMYHYNVVIYNVILQYDLFKLQQVRIQNYYGQLETNYIPYADAVPGVSSKVVEVQPKFFNSRDKYDGINTLYGYKEETNDYLGTNSNKPYHHLKADIVKLTNNIFSIYTAINSSEKYIKMMQKISANSSNIQIKSKEFDEYQTKYNKVVNIYNNDLDTYKDINNYYRAVIIISIIVIILAIYLFSIPNIDSNAQVGILFGAVITMILFYIFYLANLKITETFINCRYNNINTTNSYPINFDFTKYKQYLRNYNIFLLILASGFSVTGETLAPINDFVDEANSMRGRKILFYKNKITEYTGASELLKKNADNYYYLMTLIYFTTIIALSAMALYLLFPTMLFTVIIFAIIIFLILLIYIVYKINRSTRLFNDKNYWANFNPSNEVIKEL
jgi:hypothetical protein